MLLVGCPPDGSEDAPALVGPDCAIWLEIAERAQACDPSLAALRAALERAPSEERCRAAARSLLHRPPEPAAGLESLYTRPYAPVAGPLTTRERAALETKRFAATLDLVPDLRGEPGLTPTRAWLGEREIAVDDDGSLHTTATPGTHTIRIKYGSEEREHCVRLAECEAVRVLLHGAYPARHVALSTGPCSEPIAPAEGSSPAEASSSVLPLSPSLRRPGS